MKTVISIDFDIIMAPTINYYNMLVPKTSWEDMDDLMSLVFPDAQHYQRLTEWLYYIIPTLDKKNIHFIDSHEQINDFVKERINLFNIDHHHDIGYQEEQKDEATCADWVKDLYQQGLIEHYTWIGNENSDQIDSPIINDFFPLKEYQLEKLQNIDELYICLSPPWVPPKWRPLFFSWMDYCNYYFDTQFEIYQREK